MCSFIHTGQNHPIVAVNHNRECCKEARDKFNIDMQNSWVIGDKEADVQAANAVGIDNTILVKSGHVIDETNSNAKFILKSIKDSIQIIK